MLPEMWPQLIVPKRHFDWNSDRNSSVLYISQKANSMLQYQKFQLEFQSKYFLEKQLVSPK